MKRFHFPLRSVSILRSHREAIARASLASAMRACETVEARLAEARQRLSEMERLRSDGRSGRFRAADEIAFLLAYRGECATEADASKQRAAAVRDVEVRRNACVEANRAVKAIERLEASALLAHRTEAFRAEQAEFDELAGRRAGRRRLLST